MHTFHLILFAGSLFLKHLKRLRGIPQSAQPTPIKDAMLHCIIIVVATCLAILLPMPIHHFRITLHWLQTYRANEAPCEFVMRLY